MPFQKGQSGNAGGRKDKPFRDALRLELAAAGEDQKALREIARALIESAKSGDNINSIKEFADRIDGKVPQALIGDDDEPPIKTVFEWAK